jgi:predicted GNAT family acetyltransferase
VGNIDYDVAIKHAKEILIAEKNGEPAGLLLLNDFHKGAMIEIVYTSDKHRHAGIATDLYTHAIQHTNAKHIVVPYAVVEKNIDYWKQLGFCSFGVHGNDHYVDVDLVRLSTLPQKPFTPEQHKLTLAEIKIQQEILKRGFCVAEYV